MLNASDDQNDTVPSEFCDDVRDIVSELLEPEQPLDESSDVFDLGANSIVAAQLVGRLRQRFDVRVTLRDIFTARTIGAIAVSMQARRDASTAHR